jgi:flagellar assembly protein FliH
MSRKIIKDEFVPSEKLKHFGFQVYATVERGEKVKKLEKVGEMEYTPGEIDHKIISFDKDIELGRAVIVQDRGVRAEKYAPKQFNEPANKPVNEKKPEPEPAPVVEEPPPPPAITEEQLAQARAEGHKAGFNEGIIKGRQEGRTEAQKTYDAHKNDYIAKLEKTYTDVAAQVKVFEKAVNQLDEALPEILVSMVRDIVGEERKVNDQIVASVAKKSLRHLRELERVVFHVNPADVEHMKGQFPDYETQADKNVVRGSLRVATNIGEMNFSIEKMLEEFIGRIHEEFSQTEEG